MRTVNIILNILSRLNLIQRPDAFSKEILEKFVEIPERLAFHLVDLINKSITELHVFLGQFSDVIREMRKVEQQFRRDFSIMARKQIVGENEGWNNDLEIIEQAERTIQEIVDI